MSQPPLWEQKLKQIIRTGSPQEAMKAAMQLARVAEANAKADSKPTGRLKAENKGLQQELKQAQEQVESLTADNASLLAEIQTVKESQATADAAKDAERGATIQRLEQERDYAVSNAQAQVQSRINALEATLGKHNTALRFLVPKAGVDALEMFFSVGDKMPAELYSLLGADLKQLQSWCSDYNRADADFLLKAIQNPNHQPKWPFIRALLKHRFNLDADSEIKARQEREQQQRRREEEETARRYQEMQTAINTEQTSERQSLERQRLIDRQYEHQPVPTAPCGRCYSVPCRCNDRGFYQY